MRGVLCDETEVGSLGTRSKHLYDVPVFDYAQDFHLLKINMKLNGSVEVRAEEEKPKRYLGDPCKLYSSLFGFSYNLYCLNVITPPQWT